MNRLREDPRGPAIPSIDEFREYCREWLKEHMPTRGDESREPDQSRAAKMRRARRRQALLYDAGLAGIAFPVEYGGQGLTRAHQEVLNTESVPYAMPAVLGVPSIGVLGATLLDCGSETLRRRHLARILRGDEVWVQLLSEPSGGSDLAAVRLRADVDGDEWVLNGAKMWTSNAQLADWGMCLARTDWSAPKHSGLTMFAVPLDSDGLSIHDITLANGHSDFCQEFFDDVRVSGANVIGEVNEGWRVASQLLVHERDTVGGNSKYARPADGGFDGEPGYEEFHHVAAAVSSEEQDRLDALVDAYLADWAHRCLTSRITLLIDDGSLPATAGALLKLSSSLRGNTLDDAAFHLAAGSAVFDRGDGAIEIGQRYLVRQAMSLAGGSNEMQRNIISERLLQMPRESRPDLGVPFNEIGAGGSGGDLSHLKGTAQGRQRLAAHENQ